MEQFLMLCWNCQGREGRDLLEYEGDDRHIKIVSDCRLGAEGERCCGGQNMWRNSDEELVSTRGRRIQSGNMDFVGGG